MQPFDQSELMWVDSLRNRSQSIADALYGHIAVGGGFFMALVCWFASFTPAEETLAALTHTQSSEKETDDES